MNLRKEYQRIVRPILKALPILIGLVALTIWLGNRLIDYMPVEFQSIGAIKINNLNYSQSGIDLFQENGRNIPQQNQTFLTEVEVFKSKNLIKQALAQLGWELSVYRVGDIKTIELYEDRPFIIDYTIVSNEGYDQEIYLRYAGDNVFHLVESKTKLDNYIEITLGKTIKWRGLSFQIKLNDAVLAAKPSGLNAGDLFLFRVNSMASLIKTIDNKNLFVRSVEKDISIIKIYFNHELPLKSQQFVDALMEAYMEECRSYKEKMSDETLAYIDSRILDVGNKLRFSESELAFFRTKNNMVNTKQETDAALKEIMELDLRKMDFEMQKQELKKLYLHLTSGEELNEYAPNFKALENPIFQQSYMKVQELELTRQDLLQKYVVESSEIANIDTKIKQLRVFINESISTTLDNLKTRQNEVVQTIRETNSHINAYPEKERKLVVLEREVSLNENMYNFLVKRRTELAISRSSNLYPHKIIEQASLPSDYISPNRPLILGLLVFIILGASIICVYIYDYFMAKIDSKKDLDEVFQIPVLGTVWKNKNNKFQSFEMVSGLIPNIAKLPKSTIDGQGKLLIITSLTSGEGKSFTCTNLARTLASAGERVLLIDMDIRKPSLHHAFNAINLHGVSAILEGQKHPFDTICKTDNKFLHFIPAGQLNPSNRALFFSKKATGFIQDLRWHYDVILVDSAPIGIVPDIIPLMHQSTANLFMVRVGYTKRRYTQDIEECCNEWKIPNMYLVLNDDSPSKAYVGYSSYSEA